MSELIKSKTVNLVFNKTDIAIMLGCNYQMLKKFMPEHLKKQLAWNKGRANFKDLEVDLILQHFRPLLNREERLKIIYPKGF
jgi:hypothetical protein